MDARRRRPLSCDDAGSRSRCPHGLSATSTHDTKRGEDARARLHVITRHRTSGPQRVDRWHGMNAESMGRLPAGEERDASVEQFLYQSLLGAWPIAPLGDEDDLIFLHERMLDFAVKALREAKLRTSWDDPNERYEAAIRAFLGISWIAGTGLTSAISRNGRTRSSMPA